VETDKQAFDPSLGRLPTPQGVVVALLDLAPLLGQEAFEEILPAYERLGLGSLLDVCFREVIVGRRPQCHRERFSRRAHCRSG